MTRRTTDAEIALHENALGPDAEFMSPATLASTGLLLLAELKAERERCAELRRLLEENQHKGDGFDRARCVGCSARHDRPCADWCEIAKALKETE